MTDDPWVPSGVAGGRAGGVVETRTFVQQHVMAGLGRPSRHVIVGGEDERPPASSLGDVSGPSGQSDAELAARVSVQRGRQALFGKRERLDRDGDDWRTQSGSRIVVAHGCIGVRNDVAEYFQVHLVEAFHIQTRFAC